MAVGSVDPSDPAAVGAAAARWLSARLGVEVGLAERPSRAGEGFDTTIHLVRFAGEGLPTEWARPLVVRIHPSPGRAPLVEREAAMQGFCADHGYPCPRVLAVAAPGELLDLPVQLMERAPGVTMVAALLRRPWRFPALVATLGGLHARLHALPVDGFPAPADAVGTVRAQAERRLHLVRAVVGGPAPPVDGLADALDRIEALLPGLDGGPTAVCHGDYHPLNVLVAGAAAQVIDWTSAGLGDPHGDVSGLLTVLRAVPVGAPGRAGKAVTRLTTPAMARGYLRAYERSAPRPLDRDRLRRWEPVHVLHDWARAALAARAGEPGRRQVDPAAVDWCRRRFDDIAG